MLGLVLYNISFTDKANITEKDYCAIANKLHDAIDKQEFMNVTGINTTIKSICDNFGKKRSYNSSETADYCIQNYTSGSRRKFHLYKSLKTEVVYDISNSDLGSLFLIIIYEKSSNTANKSIKVVKCSTGRFEGALATSASVYVKYSISSTGKYSYEVTPIKTIEETKVLIDKLTECNELEELTPPVTIHDVFLYNQKKSSYPMMLKACTRMLNIMEDQQVNMTSIAHNTHIGINGIKELPTHMDGLDNLVRMFKQLGYNIDFNITKIDEDSQMN